MKPSLCLLITALFLVSCDQQEVATTNRAAPVVVDGSRLVMRNEIAYEINSTTPFTGDVLTYHENGQLSSRAATKDGKLDGITETYFENGKLSYRANTKDGELDGITENYFENGTLKSRMNLKDGEPDGISERYSEDGTLRSRTNFKDGEQLGQCYEPGCTDFN